MVDEGVGGREFQQCGPETQKPRKPKDLVEKSGIRRSDREADRRWDRPNKEAVGIRDRPKPGFSFSAENETVTEDYVEWMLNSLKIVYTCSRICFYFHPDIP